MAYLTRDGSAWTPEYLTAIDASKCIGCGRCYKAARARSCICTASTIPERCSAR